MRREDTVDECASAIWQGGSTLGKGDGLFDAPVVAGYADGDGAVGVGAQVG